VRESEPASATDDPIRLQTKILFNKIADMTMTSPFIIDPDTKETTEMIMDLLEPGMSHPAFWLYSIDSLATERLFKDVTLLDKLAPLADTVLAVSIWRRDRCPAYILLIGWLHTPTCRSEIEGFVESILANSQGLAVMRQAKLMAKVPIAFSIVQIHELRTHLHQLSNTTHR